MCKSFDKFMETHKEQDIRIKTVNSICEWLDKNITYYKSDMMGYIQYEQIDDIITDIKKEFL